MAAGSDRRNWVVKSGEATKSNTETTAVAIR